ncbi:MAG: DMT family transporter [Eubacteriales bacterium]|nr:DMT family transporter [Eubacteriales bacterium]
MRNKTKITGHLLAIITAFIWGVTFVSSKILLREFTPVELLLNRFVVGYITLWIIRPKRLRFENWKRELLYAGAGLTGVCLYYLGENLALVYTQAANVSVIVSSAPLFVSLFAHFFLKDEKIKRYFYIGFACSIVGILLLSFGGGQGIRVNAIGDGICVLAAVFWGVYSIIVKKINEGSISAVLTTRRIFFYGIVFMIPLALLSGYQLKPERFANTINLFNFLFLGVCACALCFIMWNKAVAILGAIKTSAYIYAIPAITIVFSVLVLHEKITLLMGIGTILTIVGLVVSEKE